MFTMSELTNLIGSNPRFPSNSQKVVSAVSMQKHSNLEGKITLGVLAVYRNAMQTLVDDIDAGAFDN